MHRARVRLIPTHARTAYRSRAARRDLCRFSETESIAVLTLVISRYRVEVKEEPQFAGETFEQRKARLLKSKLSVTL